MDENYGILYVVPKVGEVASSTLLAAVKTYVTVTKPNTVTFRLDTASAVYNTINVWVRVHRVAGVTEGVLEARLEAAYAAFFALYEDDEEETPNTNVDFGFNYKDEDGLPAGVIPWSDLFNVARDTPGVRKIASDGLLLNGVAEDVDLENRDFPKLGTVTVLFAD